MRALFYMVMSALALCCFIACGPEKKVKDRTAAHSMFAKIVSLTKSYTSRLENAKDSAEWARLSSEYEDSLVKINFSYPPDTDLLLSEGQNDTIANLVQKYTAVRDARIDAILHPVAIADTIDTISIDSIHSSRNPGN